MMMLMTVLVLRELWVRDLSCPPQYKLCPRSWPLVYTTTNIIFVMLLYCIFLMCALLILVLIAPFVVSMYFVSSAMCVLCTYLILV